MFAAEARPDHWLMHRSHGALDRICTNYPQQTSAADQVALVTLVFGAETQISRRAHSRLRPDQPTAGAKRTGCDNNMARQGVLEAAATRIATSAVVTALEQRDGAAAAEHGSKRARAASGGVIPDPEAVAAWRTETRSRLARPLDMNLVASRTGPGNQKLFYLPSDAVIKLANEVFGEDGWTCHLHSVVLDFVSSCSSLSITMPFRSLFLAEPWLTARSPCQTLSWLLMMSCRCAEKALQSRLVQQRTCA